MNLGNRCGTNFRPGKLRFEPWVRSVCVCVCVMGYVLCVCEGVRSGRNPPESLGPVQACAFAEGCKRRTDVRMALPHRTSQCTSHATT